MTHKLMIALVVACAASTMSLAGPFYVGAAYGNTTLKADVSTIDFDASDPGWKVYAGYRFLKLFGVEGSYVDMGSPAEGSLELDATGWDAFGVGILPIGPVDLFAKVGAVNWDVKAKGSGSDSGTDMAYGVGVGFHISKIGIRAEWEKFDAKEVDSLYMISLGVEWRFK